MLDDYEQIEIEQETPESPEELLLRATLGIVKKSKAETYRIQKQLDRIEAQQQSLPSGSIVAEGKQKELLAILNIVYNLYVSGTTKAEFMQRMSTAFGAPGLENYNGNLHNIMTANKYADIFEDFKNAGVAEKEKMLNKSA